MKIERGLLNLQKGFGNLNGENAVARRWVPDLHENQGEVCLAGTWFESAIKTVLWSLKAGSSRQAVGCPTVGRKGVR